MRMGQPIGMWYRLKHYRMFKKYFINKPLWEDLFNSFESGVWIDIFIKSSSNWILYEKYLEKYCWHQQEQLSVKYVSKY